MGQERHATATPDRLPDTRCRQKKGKKEETNGCAKPKETKNNNLRKKRKTHPTGTCTPPTPKKKRGKEKRKWKAKKRLSPYRKTDNRIQKGKKERGASYKKLRNMRGPKNRPGICRNAPAKKQKRQVKKEKDVKYRKSNSKFDCLREEGDAPLKKKTKNHGLFHCG